MSIVSIQDQTSFLKCKAITYAKATEEIKKMVESYINKTLEQACTDATVSALTNLAYEYGLSELANKLENELIKK